MKPSTPVRPRFCKMRPLLLSHFFPAAGAPVLRGAPRFFFKDTVFASLLPAAGAPVLRGAPRFFFKDTVSASLLPAAGALNSPHIKQAVLSHSSQQEKVGISKPSRALGGKNVRYCRCLISFDGKKKEGQTKEKSTHHGGVSVHDSSGRKVRPGQVAATIHPRATL